MALSYRHEEDMVSLHVETSEGSRKEFVVSDIAREAIAFAVAQSTCFDVRALPGDLSAQEREAIGEALEETGVFRRVYE